ncbi:hypothetical protein MJO29_002080 [Puccinia striiformis f. sp. tritici]|nr:hypothetical protein MJO29_002080 [Puccinia striiformis f. sp. tritici]
MASQVEVLFTCTRTLGLIAFGAMSFLLFARTTMAINRGTASKPRGLMSKENAELASLVTLRFLEALGIGQPDMLRKLVIFVLRSSRLGLRSKEKY